MKRLSCLMLLLALLPFSSPCLGEETVADLVAQIKSNDATLMALRDADIFLYALDALQAGESAKVTGFMNYMLDAIVCETAQNEEKMNQWQRNRLERAYRRIKAYRSKAPAETGVAINLGEMSSFFPAYDPNLRACAEKVLRDIETREREQREPGDDQTGS